MSNLLGISRLGVGTNTPLAALDVSGGNINCSGNINANNMGMFRNKVMNGDMRMDQRTSGVTGAAATSTALAAASAYGVDRFQGAVGSASGAVCAAQVALSAADKVAVGGAFDKAVQVSGLPTAGLIAYMPFDNSTADQIGGFAGSITSVGTITYAPSCRVGAAALDLNANATASSTITTGLVYNLSPILALGAMTVSMWINTPAFTAHQTVFSFCTSAALGYEWMINGSGQLFIDSWFSGSVGTYCDIAGSASTAITANAWTHLCTTVTAGGKHVLYINGVQAGTGSTQSGIISDSAGSPFTTLRIGHRNAASVGYAFKGIIDDFRVYNRALSASEAAALAGFASIPASPSSAKLSGRADFNNTLVDSIGGLTSPSYAGTLVYSPNSRTGSACLDLTANTMNATASVYVDYALTIPSAFSASMWINPSAIGLNNPYIASFGYNLNWGYNIGLTNNGVYVDTISSGSISTNVQLAFNTSLAYVPANAWSLVTVTMSATPSAAGINALYINGNLAASAPITAGYITGYNALSAINKVRLGSIASGAGAWKGLIDDFRLWNTALTPAEVAGLYYSYSAAGYSLYRQPIEAQNMSDLGWGTSAAVPATVSVWIKNNSAVAQQYSLSLNNAGHGLTTYLPFEASNAADTMSGITGPVPTGTTAYSSATYKTGSSSLDLMANPAAGGTAVTSLQYAVPSYTPNANTYSMWINPSTVTGNTNYLPFTAGQSGGAYGLEFMISYVSSGVYGIMAQMCNAAQNTWSWSPTNVIASQPQLLSNTWNHIAATVNGSYLTLYLNGVGYAPAAYSSPASHNVICIGQRFNARGLSYKGYIDDIKIYNRALSAAEIASIYNANVSSTVPTSLIMPRSVVYATPSIPANTWQKVAFTVPGDTTGYWATDNSAGAHLALALGAGASVSTSNMAAASNNTSAVWNSLHMYAGSNVQTFGASSNNILALPGSSVLLTGVQLEKGDMATNFEMRSYGAELGLCQRYYQVPIYLSGFRRYTQNIEASPIVFSPMRAIPSTNSTYTVGTNVGSFGVYPNSTNSGIISIQVTSAGNAVIDVQGLTITLNAEL
jgi:hypothetical protein